MAHPLSLHLGISCDKPAYGIRARLARLGAWLRCALEVSRQRRALYRLDDTALNDLGLSRADAWQEADKPFWEQPAEEGQRRSC